MSRLRAWWTSAAASARGAGLPGAQSADDEWALWHRARSGHAPSATELVGRLGRQAMGLAMQFAGSREDAEDAVQESFLRLWRSEPRDDHGSRLSTYFNTIVINRCRSRVAARTDIPTEDDALHALLDSQQGTHETHEGGAALSSAHTSRRLREAIAALPARQRMAIAMWTYADATAEDVARALNLDANAAHQLLYRAKKSLRTFLEGAPS